MYPLYYQKWSRPMQPVSDYGYLSPPRVPPRMPRRRYLRPQRDKKKFQKQPLHQQAHYDPTYYNHKAVGARPVAPEIRTPMSIPPGVWTSNPTMFAGAPSPAYMFATGNGTLPNGTGGGVSPQAALPPHHHVANGYPKNVYQSEPNLNHDTNGLSWYHRTLRRAKSMLKQIPTVFQVQGPDQYSPGSGVEDVYSSRRRLQAEESQTLQVADMTITEASHRIQPQTAQEMKASRNGGIGGTTARAYSTLPPRIPEDAAVDHASGPHVAKVYSDYHPGWLNHETGEETLDQVDEDGLPITQNSRYIMRPAQNNDSNVFITQSDWALNRNGVSRSQSNVERKAYQKKSPKSTEKNNAVPKANPVQRSESSAAGVGGKYGQGVYLANGSSKDAQLFAYKRQGGLSKKSAAPKSPGVDVIRPGIARPVNVDKAGQKSTTHFIAPQADIEAAEALEMERRPKRVAPPPPAIAIPPARPQSSLTSNHSQISALVSVHCEPSLISQSNSSRLSSAHDEPEASTLPVSQISSSPANSTIMIQPEELPITAPVERSPSSLLMNYTSPPDNPNALYAIPSRVRNSVKSQAATDDPQTVQVNGVEDKPPEPKPVIASPPISPDPETPTNPPTSPIPAPPPPPPLPAHVQEPQSPDQDAVVRPTEEAQPFEQGNPLTRRSRGRSVIEFNIRGEALATDAFAFLDDFDDVMSFGDEGDDDDDAVEQASPPRVEHFNY